MAPDWSDTGHLPSCSYGCRPRRGLPAWHQGRRWLVGKTLTVADFALAITLPYAEPAHLPIAEFPAVQRWHAALCEIDAWREPFPKVAGAT